MDYIYVFFAQIAFNLLKVLEIRYTVQHDIVKLLVNSVFLGALTLVSIFISVESLLNGDLWIILFFLAGGVIGKYFGMKVRVKAPTQKDIVYTKLMEKEKVI